MEGGATTERLPHPELPAATPEGESRREHAVVSRERTSAEGAAIPAPVPPQSSPRAVPVPQKTPLREDIEAALVDERLRQLFAALEPSIRQVFRAAANALAAQFETMIASGEVKIARTHTGIVDWLAIIPNLNRWFLLQEAKVKTDAILALVRRASAK